MRASVLAVAVTACALMSQAQQPELHDVPHDGNCLFSAAALSMALSADGATGAVSDAASLRASAMDVLCPPTSSGLDANLDLGGLPAPLVVERLHGESEIGYCQRMRRNGEWGTTAEILALTRVLRREIRVLTSFGVEPYGAEQSAESSLPPLFVHFANGHYRAATLRSDKPDL